MNKSPFLLKTNSERERATRLGIARMCVGGTLMIPPLALRVFGVPKEQDTPAVRLVARLFGIRNIALAAWCLLSRDQAPADRMLCYRVNAAVDGADVVALGWSGLTGDGMRQAAAMGSILGLSVLVGWIEMIAEVGAEAPEPDLALARETAS